MGFVLVCINDLMILMVNIWGVMKDVDWFLINCKNNILNGFFLFKIFFDNIV